jgi:hypothetical protein
MKTKSEKRNPNDPDPRFALGFVLVILVGVLLFIAKMSGLI